MSAVISDTDSWNKIMLLKNYTFMGAMLIIFPEMQADNFIQGGMSNVYTGPSVEY